MNGGEEMDLNKILEEIKAEYKYKVELHNHTTPVSGCSRYRPRDMVRKYKELGYSAFALTNHFNVGMLKKNEDDAISFFMNDFYEAQDEGEKLGVKVLLGVEIHFADLPNDYLVYGIDESDLHTIYNYVGRSSKEYYDNCRNDRNVIIQAHPCRKNLTYTPDWIDGVEAYNLHPGHNSAIALAVRHACQSKKLHISGSDLHHPGREGLTAMMTRVIPKDSFELAQIIKSGDYVLAIGDDIILQPSYK